MFARRLSLKADTIGIVTVALYTDAEVAESSAFLIADPAVETPSLVHLVLEFVAGFRNLLSSEKLIEIHHIATSKVVLT